MRSDIEAKLADVLTRPIEAECQVVYILVEVRKLLEHEGTKNTLNALTLCCDWSIHTKLDRNEARKVLKEVDDLFGKYLGGKADKAEHDRLAAILHLTPFREQLCQFLKSHMAAIAGLRR